MKNNNDHRVACTLCVNTCEATINVIQEFVAKCSSTDVVECIPQAGRLRQYIHECIQACNGCVASMKQHIAENPIEGKQGKYRSCIDTCTECAALCKRFITLCEEDHAACLGHTDKMINMLQQCSLACKACLE